MKLIQKSAIVGMLIIFVISSFLAVPALAGNSVTLKRMQITITSIKIVEKLDDEDYYVEFGAMGQRVYGKWGPNWATDYSYSDNVGEMWNFPAVTYHYFYSTSSFLLGWDHYNQPFYYSCVVFDSYAMDIANSGFQYYLVFRLTKDRVFDLYYYTFASVDSGIYKSGYEFTFDFPDWGGSIYVTWNVLWV